MENTPTGGKNSRLSSTGTMLSSQIVLELGGLLNIADEQIQLCKLLGIE